MFFGSVAAQDMWCRREVGVVGVPTGQSRDDSGKVGIGEAAVIGCAVNSSGSAWLWHICVLFEKCCLMPDGV